MTELRAAYGGMGAQAARATHLEAALIGKAWNADAFDGIDDALARDFAPMTDHRGTDAYRRRAAVNLVRRFQAETAGQTSTQVWDL